MPDGRRRSREGWADAMEDGPPHTPAHTHRLPRAVRLAIVGLTGAVFLLLVALGLVSVYVYQANQYVQGRGEFRDAEAQRLAEQNRASWCTALDNFPQGVPALDRLRAFYGCGPGIPLDQLSPDERAQLSGNARPTTVAPSSPVPRSAAPDPTGGAVQTPQSAQPASPTLAPTPAPTPAVPTTRPPLIDLGRVTDPVCDAAIVCF